MTSKSIPSSSTLILFSGKILPTHHSSAHLLPRKGVPGGPPKVKLQVVYPKLASITTMLSGSVHDRNFCSTKVLVRLSVTALTFRHDLPLAHLEPCPNKTTAESGATSCSVDTPQRFPLHEAPRRIVPVQAGPSRILGCVPLWDSPPTAMQSRSSLASSLKTSLTRDGQLLATAIGALLTWSATSLRRSLRLVAYMTHASMYDRRPREKGPLQRSYMFL